MLISELQLGDVVELFEGAYGTATVKSIRDGVTLFRPYATTSDFSMGGTVICYTGIEEVTFPLESRDRQEWLVYQRKEVA